MIYFLQAKKYFVQSWGDSVRPSGMKIEDFAMLGVRTLTLLLGILLHPPYTKRPLKGNSDVTMVSHILFKGTYRHISENSYFSNKFQTQHNFN